MPDNDLVLEEQRLRDNMGLMKRKLYDMEKRKSEIESVITTRYALEEEVIQEKWKQVFVMENEVKALSLNAKIHIENFSKNLKSARDHQLIEGQRLAEQENRLAKSKKEMVGNLQKAVKNARRTKEVKASSEQALAEIRAELEDVEAKKKDVDLRVETLAVRQQEAFEMEQEMERSLKVAGMREERARITEMKSIELEKKAIDAVKEAAIQRQKVLDLRADVDATMAAAKEIADRTNEFSKVLAKEKVEVKEMRQTLMYRMIALDKREALLKKKEQGE